VENHVLRRDAAEIMSEFSARLLEHGGRKILITSQVMGPYFEQHPRIIVTPLGYDDLPNGVKKHNERAFALAAHEDVDVLGEVYEFVKSLRYVRIYPIVLHGEDGEWKGWTSGLHAIDRGVSPLSGAASDLAWSLSVLAPDYVADRDVIDLVVSTLAADGYRAVCAKFDDVYVMRVHKS
jgi:hypothetical protein